MCNLKINFPYIKHDVSKGLELPKFNSILILKPDPKTLPVKLITERVNFQWVGDILISLLIIINKENLNNTCLKISRILMFIKCF